MEREKEKGTAGDADSAVTLLQALLAEATAQNASLKKQLRWNRILGVSAVSMALILLVTAILVLPPLLRVAKQAQRVLEQSTEAVSQVTDVMEDVEMTLEDIQSLFEQGGLVEHSTEAMEQAAQKIGQLDIDSLNRAITDLANVVEPFEKFFSKF